MSQAAIDRATLGLHSIEQYEPLIGAAATGRILEKANQVRGSHIVHISSTFYGGGVTEILTPLTLLMNAIGVQAGWRLLQGTPAFFGCTKKLHNALHGDVVELSSDERAIYERVVYENATRLHLDDCDVVAVHDPQPLPLIGHCDPKNTPWLWQCHVDLSAPQQASWDYLSRFIEQYDAAIFSLPEYAKDLGIAQHFLMPAIDPFSAKNTELSDDEIAKKLAHYGIPTDRPLVTQVSRFDRWKDPIGVIDAVAKARKEVDCLLVLVGNNASDDPESSVILKTIKASLTDDVMLITADDPVLVNALQRRSAVVLQKSTREGFGLTVTEAMWKGAAVIGGDVGGIRRQIRDGDNGFLVNSIDAAAERIVQLLKDPGLRERLGKRAKESVRETFLMSRLLEEWLDVVALYRS